MLLTHRIRILFIFSIFISCSLKRHETTIERPLPEKLIKPIVEGKQNKGIRDLKLQRILSLAGSALIHSKDTLLYAYLKKGQCFDFTNYTPIVYESESKNYYLTYYTHTGDITRIEYYVNEDLSQIVEVNTFPTCLILFVKKCAVEKSLFTETVKQDYINGFIVFDKQQGVNYFIGLMTPLHRYSDQEDIRLDQITVIMNLDKNLRGIRQVLFRDGIAPQNEPFLLEEFVYQTSSKKISVKSKEIPFLKLTNKTRVNDITKYLEDKRAFMSKQSYRLYLLAESREPIWYMGGDY
ncbi:hypothetical protein QNI19_31340 [Cytophagaceae bacterium DM2B3-1]|uniref:Lipoprotein n=1 Tax=Xanthocytophaga flava TaxID=3048013 RepID=A0ABT7CUN0_9BACT|nr:hypothetical protein [Xanthocytophaga flavus]MDJ1497475.1 hypothetical protein [Xanthocytophaga flavus]